MISINNLLVAWKKFSKGKQSSPDIARFELRLEEELWTLYDRLQSGTWVNGSYTAKRIADPKPRTIHIASVRDRVLYQAVYQQLYKTFDKAFFYDSYASREGKGTHAGVRRLSTFARRVSANFTESAFVLKCDIRKYFEHIDHEILFSLLSKRIEDNDLLTLLRRIIGSFEAGHGRGLPLGNVTSQLFANIYLNNLDQYIKHNLKVSHYIRYCDDFVILDESRFILKELTERIRNFLQQSLRLELHPNKVTIRKLRQGTDFLGYVSLPHFRVLRTRTKRKMIRCLLKLAGTVKNEGDFKKALPIIRSYLGMLSHCESEQLKRQVERLFGKRF